MGVGLCERCGKSQATFHVTDIDPAGEKSERHLCERCAVEEGFMPSPKSAVNVTEYIESFLSSTKAGSAIANLECPHCGLRYVEFRNQGLLGCRHDYDVFVDPLAKLISRAHNGATHHTGKSPKATPTVSREAQVRKLRKDLQDAIAGEDYERAARLRDQISELERE